MELFEKRADEIVTRAELCVSKMSNSQEKKLKTNLCDEIEAFMHDVPPIKRKGHIDIDYLSYVGELERISDALSSCGKRAQNKSMALLLLELGEETKALLKKLQKSI